jgi:hypothetical protein
MRQVRTTLPAKNRDHKRIAKRKEKNGITRLQTGKTCDKKEVLNSISGAFSKFL